MILQRPATKEIDPLIVVFKYEDAVVIEIISLAICIQEREAFLKVWAFQRIRHHLCMANMKETCQPQQCYDS